MPLEQLAARGTSSLWYQVFAGDPAARTQIEAGVTAGCKAVCITVGAALSGGDAKLSATSVRRDMAALTALTRGVRIPVLVKGISTPEAAALALQHDVKGIVVSNHGGLVGPDRDAIVLALPRILDAVGGRIPVLLDGSVRRGTDVLKALALGAKAVLVGRPIVWGLAAYGAEGVQGVVEMLQGELARYMGMCGVSRPAQLDATFLRVHAAASPKAPARPSS